VGFSASSYKNIIGANDRVRLVLWVFLTGSNIHLLPSFMHHHQELNFDIVAVSDIWKLRREEGVAHLKDKLGHDVKECVNNDELYQSQRYRWSDHQYG
jgi:hypothetical protein